MTSWVLLVVAAGLVVDSLWLRTVTRAPYFGGHELEWAAQGLWLVSSKPAAAALRWGLRAWRLDAPLTDGAFLRQTVSVPDSVLASILPGTLTTLWPWLYWGVVVNLTLATVAFVALWRATWPTRLGAGVLLAMVATDGPLLSTAACGFPWITGLLPHGLALAVVCSPRLRQSWWGVVVTALAVWTVTQVYEGARLVAVTFLVAALTVRAPWWQRASWLAAWAATTAITFWFLVLGSYQNMAWLFFDLRPPSAATLQPLAMLHDLPSLLWRVPQALVANGQALLAVLGLVALVALPRRVPERWFLRLTWLGQFAVVCYLIWKCNGTPGWRLLGWEFMSMAAILVWLRTLPTGGWWRATVPLVSIVLIGFGVVQLRAARDFYRAFYAHRTGVEYPLPTFPSHGSEYLTIMNREAVDWAQAMVADVRSGRRLWVLSNGECYLENRTNPQTLLERVYLQVGHAAFVEQVAIFGPPEARCVYNCLPMRPMTELEDFVAAEARGRIAYEAAGCYAMGTAATSLRTQAAALAAAFPAARWQLAPTEGFRRAVLE